MGEIRNSVPSKSVLKLRQLKQHSRQMHKHLHEKMERHAECFYVCALTFHYY